MRFHDSLQQNTSHFHAVITRLRAVLQLQEGDRPLLFLLDEILQGTNSQDRVTGAQAVIRTLIDRGGVGLVTTHDLALTEIVDALNSRARNVHFVDQLIDGRLQFDYRMRPGVVQTTNALALMRQMGLDV
jgi:DNA mismatch repair ATPase MutS